MSKSTSSAVRDSASPAKVAGGVMTLLCFLLPLKFGGLAALPESPGFYPPLLTDWIYVAFPPHTVGIFGAYMLLWAVMTRTQLPRKQAGLILAWCAIPALAALPGIINGCPDESWGEVSNLLGIGAFAAAAGIFIARDAVWGRRFAAALLLGGLCSAAYGIYQHYYGLDELREFAAENIRKGLPVPKAIQLKLQDPRVFSTLASPNIFSSLLLMIAPLAWYFAWEWGKKFAPEKVSRWFFGTVFFMLIAGGLFFASSRSSLLCPLLAGVLAVFSLKKLKLSFRIAAFIAAIMAICLGAWFAVRYGRGLASMGERADYLRSAAVVTVKHPVAGGGWGSFFRTHRAIKLSDTDESARDPHNVVAAFASQAGVIPGILMLGVLILPLILLWKHRFTPGFPMAVFWSGVLFTLHSLMDCDWHSPALPVTMGILYFAAFREVDTDDLPLKKGFAVTLTLVALAAASAWVNWQYQRRDVQLARLCDKLMPPTEEVAAQMAHVSVSQLAAEVKEVRPESPVVWDLEGMWYQHTGNLIAAEKCFRTALKLDPGRPDVLKKLAVIEAKRGNYDAARKLIRQAHESFPKNPRYDVEKFEREYCR